MMTKCESFNFSSLKNIVFTKLQMFLAFYVLESLFRIFVEYETNFSSHLVVSEILTSKVQKVPKSFELQYE